MTDLAEPLPGVTPARVRHPARGYLLYLVAALLFALNGTVAKTLLLGGIEPSVPVPGPGDGGVPASCSCSSP